MICLAKAIKNCRPWMDLGLFWMQILSMVGRKDPLMILDSDEYEMIYNTQNEIGNDIYLRNNGMNPNGASSNDGLLDSNLLFMKQAFNGARYMTLNEYKLYAIRREMQLEAHQAAEQALNNNPDDDNSEVKDDLDVFDRISIDDNGSSPSDIDLDESACDSSLELDEKDAIHTRSSGQDGNVYVGISTTTSSSVTSSGEKKPRSKKKKKRKTGMRTRNDKEDRDSVLARIDMDFELAHDHEWMRSSLMERKRRKKCKRKFGNGYI